MARPNSESAAHKRGSRTWRPRVDTRTRRHNRRTCSEPARACTSCPLRTPCTGFAASDASRSSCRRTSGTSSTDARGGTVTVHRNVGIYRVVFCGRRTSYYSLCSCATAVPAGISQRNRAFSACLACEQSGGAAQRDDDAQRMQRRVSPSVAEDAVGRAFVHVPK